MPITDTAPYGSSGEIIKILEMYRDTGLGNRPITTAAVQKLGAQSEVARRAVLSLKLLDLIDDDGEPTATLKAFKSAPHDKYHQLFADHLLSAYSSVFAYTGRDISKKSTVELENAFRDYKQTSLRGRMVSCFVGLSTYAGLVPESDKPKPGPRIAKVRPVKKAKPGQVPPVRDQEPPAAPYVPKSEIESLTHKLSTGGDLTISVTGSFVALTSSERDFVFKLFDELKGFGQQFALPAGAPVENEHRGVTGSELLKKENVR